MAAAPGRAAGTVLASPAIDVAAVRSTLVAELAAARAERADLTRRAEECDGVAATLAELPGRTDRSAMIPLGRAAFLPGRLSSSPSVLVRVGEGPLLISWFQEISVLCCAVHPVCRQPRSDRVLAGRPRRARSPARPPPHRWPGRPCLFWPAARRRRAAGGAAGRPGARRRAAAGGRAARRGRRGGRRGGRADPAPAGGRGRGARPAAGGRRRRPGARPGWACVPGVGRGAVRAGWLRDAGTPPQAALVGAPGYLALRLSASAVMSE